MTDDLDHEPAWVAAGRFPPNCENGDERPESIFQAIGQMMHSWECMNLSMDLAFQIASSSPHAGPMAAFAKNDNNTVRIMMLSACIRLWASVNRRPEVYLRFRALEKKIKIVTSLRNHFAHGVVAALNGETLEYRSIHAPKGEYFAIKPIRHFGDTDGISGVKRWYSSRVAIEGALAAALLKDELDKLALEGIAGQTGIAFPLTGLSARHRS